MPVILTTDADHPHLYVLHLSKLWQWADLFAQIEAAAARTDSAIRKDVIIYVSALSYAPLGTFECLTQIVLTVPPLNGGLIIIATSNILVKGYMRLFQRITPRAQDWLFASDVAEARGLIIASRQAEAAPGLVRG